MPGSGAFLGGLGVVTGGVCGAINILFFKLIHDYRSACFLVNL